MDFPSAKLVAKTFLDYTCTCNKMISVTIVHTALRRQNTPALVSEIVEVNDCSSMIDYIQLPPSEEQNIQLIIVHSPGMAWSC